MKTESDILQQHENLLGPRKSPPGLVAIVLVLIVCLSAGFVVLGRLLTARPGEKSAQQSTTPIQVITNITQVAFDPRAGFAGKNCITVLVMGIDDNWTDTNILYTKHARTDTLFLLTLNLANQTASMLSIPRDSYVPIAGTSHSDKINSAYATGGPVRTEATFANLTGVFPDYFLVLNIDATKRLVNALGGVDLNVEHQMDYDDNWGHLHVHLKPGFQHLDGDEALEFVRYRHGKYGLAPEDGDPRRIYRQQVLMHAMIGKAKTLGAAVHSEQLVDTAMSCVDTNLSRTQIADLARIFQGFQPKNLMTAQLIGSDARGSDGAWLVVLDPVQIRAYVDWMIKGNEFAVHGLVPVVVDAAGTNRSAADIALKRLKSAGFTNTASYLKGTSSVQSTILDSGVDDRQAAYEVASALGLSKNCVQRKPAQPDKHGWTPPAKIIVTLAVESSSAASES